MKKNLYNICYELIYNIDKRWTGQFHDIVVQFACMDTNSFVKIHHDNDVSSQFVLSFGDYNGETLMLFNEKENKYEDVDTHNTLVQFDGRYKHYVTKVTHGMRYSIVFF